MLNGSSRWSLHGYIHRVGMSVIEECYISSLKLASQVNSLIWALSTQVNFIIKYFGCVKAEIHIFAMKNDRNAVWIIQSLMIRHNIRQLIRQFSWFLKVCNLQNEENSKSVKHLIEASIKRKLSTQIIIIKKMPNIWLKKQTTL